MAKISDLFYIKYGVNLELQNCKIMSDDNSEAVNFVARTSQNNGVVAKVKKIDGITPQPAGTISCAAGGSVLSSFVQLKPYYSGRDLYILTPKKEMNFNEKLFYAMCINKNAYKYSYGRQANKTLKDIIIPDSVPNWAKQLTIDYSVLDTSNGPIVLNKKNWKEFLITDLFEVKGTKTTKIEELEIYGDGIYPYVTTQSSNNGVSDSYNFFSEDGNVLTIDSAVIGYCSYQEKNFSSSDHVEKLVPKFKLNKYIALFIVTIINQENYRYSYGRKFNQTKIKNTKIKLPAINGKPDWTYMENFIKSLPYADKI
ncbi:MAG: hypothetical protein HFH47_02750 [Bacilli bacterium]|nr:hypothetical protein [Bacilli bacterium]